MFLATTSPDLTLVATLISLLRYLIFSGHYTFSFPPTTLKDAFSLSRGQGRRAAGLRLYRQTNGDSEGASYI